VLRPGAPPWLRDFADKDLLEITPKGALFIKESVVQAETTEALRELLTERFNVKAEMKKETDELRLAVLDGRQNSIKISANSVYG
jgi:DNA polymerase elongation subunit (family B)